MIVDILYTLLFLLFALIFSRRLLNIQEAKYRKSLYVLIVAHFIIGIGYYLYVMSSGGDAYGYWEVANKMTLNDFKKIIMNGQGTRFMEAINFIPVSLLGMSFFSNSMFFSMLGAFGICYFYVMTIREIPFNIKYKGLFLFPLIFFLPNLHFWSSGVGKDTILFLCISAFSYSLLNIRRRVLLLILSIMLSFLIRPHITLLLFIAFGLAYLFDAKTSKSRRIFLTTLLIGGGIAILPTVMDFADIKSVSVQVIDDRLSHQAEILNQDSGSGVDISSYPLILKVVTFLYRPFFFDINGIPAVVASFENLLLLLLSFKAFRYQPIATFKAAPFVIKGLLLFAIIGTLAFAQSLGNVGIMIRMRNMILPGLIIYFLWALSYQYLQLKAKKIGS